MDAAVTYMYTDPYTLEMQFTNYTLAVLTAILLALFLQPTLQCSSSTRTLSCSSSGYHLSPDTSNHVPRMIFHGCLPGKVMKGEREKREWREGGH